MGDRTHVTLTVLTAQADTVKAIWERPEWSGWKSDDENLNEQLTAFEFPEINNGDLSFLPALKDAGIAYDSYWCDGGDYKAGTEYCRFTEDGELELFQVYDAEVNPSIHDLRKLIDKPDELRDYIEQHIANTEPPDWDKQEEFGKLYMTRQLIQPS